MPPVDDPRVTAALDALARIDLGAALVLSERLEPAYRQRIRRFAIRDGLVRALALHYPPDVHRSPPQAMARDLSRAAACRSAAPSPGSREAALADVLAASAGKALGAKQLTNILRGERTPIRCGK